MQFPVLLHVGDIELSVSGFNEQEAPLQIRCRCTKCGVVLSWRSYLAERIEDLLLVPENLSRQAMEDALAARDHVCLCH